MKKVIACILVIVLIVSFVIYKRNEEKKAIYESYSKSTVNLEEAAERARQDYEDTVKEIEAYRKAYAKASSWK